MHRAGENQGEGPERSGGGGVRLGFLVPVSSEACLEAVLWILYGFIGRDPFRHKLASVGFCYLEPKCLIEK